MKPYISRFVSTCGIHWNMCHHGLLNTRPNMLPNEISNIDSVQSTGFKFGTHILQGDSNTPWEY